MSNRILNKIKNVEPEKIITMLWEFDVDSEKFYIKREEIKKGYSGVDKVYWSLFGTGEEEQYGTKKFTKEKINSIEFWVPTREKTT